MMAGHWQMRSQRGEETRQLKYLLGYLTDEEQGEVEDRAFADADYLGALEATEADLIDAYVRGELSQSDRSRFELRFLTSPARRRKVEFARALATFTEEPQYRESRSEGRPSLVSAFWGWNPVHFAAGMAALICIAAAAWLLSENAAIRSRVATLEAERRGFEQKEQSLSQRLSDEQNRANTLAAQHRQSSELTAPAPLVASLVLMPGLSRGQAHVERLVLSPAAQIARVEIQLDSRDEFPRFRADLRTRSGEDVLSRSNLVRRKSGSGFLVSFDVPASALGVGVYELALKGIAADHTSEDVGYYYFEVQRH
jgi:hypothetical protein